MDEQVESPTMVCISISRWKSELTTREMAPFTNNARSDGLVLRHWKKQSDPVHVAPEAPEEQADGQPREEEPPKPLEQEYPFSKYNIKARVPRRYTEEEYDQRLRNDDWSRQETDYLMDLVEEYDLRWVVIADRYDYQSQEQPQNGDAETNATALAPQAQHRTVEQMKARYYAVAACMLAIEHPPSEMSETEFELHEKMLKFDAERERARKHLASLQLNRTADEVREEAILLEELKRITANEQNFITDRRELYSRLEVPISVANTTMYQSSQGLSQLLQTLLQQDKSKKRRSLLGPEGLAIPAGQAPGQVSGGAGDTPTTANKKAGAAAPKEPQQTTKTLTPAEEAKYGVQHHDRLAPSVQFRSERAQKLTQAKSNVQTQKLAGALAELEVPVRLVMPTEQVCKEFEKLIQTVNLLLDARKVAEKVESEIRVLEASKEERERKLHEPEDKPDVKTEDEPVPTSADAPAAEPTTAEKDAPGEDAAAPLPEASAQKGDRPSSSHKRSASVLSNMSDKSSKRQRK